MIMMRKIFCKHFDNSKDTWRHRPDCGSRLDKNAARTGCRPSPEPGWSSSLSWSSPTWSSPTWSSPTWSSPSSSLWWWPSCSLDQGSHQGNQGFNHHHHRCDDGYLGHLCEKHGVLVVHIVVGHPVVQHPGLVSQTLNPEQDHQDHGEDWEEELFLMKKWWFCQSYVIKIWLWFWWSNGDCDVFGESMMVVMMAGDLTLK